METMKKLFFLYFLIYFVLNKKWCKIYMKIRKKFMEIENLKYKMKERKYEDF